MLQYARPALGWGEKGAMGGICGLIGLEPRLFEDSILDQMIARMPHRGKQVRRLRRAGLMLASLDRAAPEIWPPPGRELPTDVFAVLDGAIDNLRDLSTELLREGIQAPAQAAAILAAGLKAHGCAFLPRVRGVFAAVVQDPESDTTWVARDSLGMRSLYVHRTRSRIIFASEIRALLADPAVRLDIDHEQLRVLLTLGFNPAPHTVLKGIHKIPPGHLIEITRSGLKVLRHDQAARDGEIDLEFEDAVDGYRHALTRAIRRCGAEQKPGIFLSGGTDSSALVYLQTRDGGAAETFTATFTDHEEDEDERVPAWQAARALGTLHREREIEVGDMASHFLSVARVLEEPVAAAWAMPFLCLAETAVKHVPVVWTGQGAGALHGEGDRWRWLQLGEWVSGLPESVGGLVTGVARRLGGRGSGYSGSKLLAVREQHERIVHSFFLFEDAALDRMLRGGHAGDRETARKLLDRWREPVSEREPLAQGLYIHGRTFLPEAVFGPADRLAAENGLTIRYPLADTEVVHWLERLPATYRLDGTHGKKLHRQALSAWLPAGVLARHKHGFGEAAERWIRGPGAERVGEWLLGSAAWLPGVLDNVQVRVVMEDARRGRIPVEPLLLLVQLELWARETFLGGSR